MRTIEVKSQVLGYLDQCQEKGGNKFLQQIERAFHEGRLDHNQIRKAVIDCFKQQDKNAVLLGALLLQLDNNEIYELLKEKINKN